MGLCAYRDLLKDHCAKAGVSVWSWVLMPNHVHLILTPSHADGIRAALSRVHRIYAGCLHAREKRIRWRDRVSVEVVVTRRECSQE